MAGKWTRPPTKLVDAFDCALAGFPDAERRPLFGCPCVFLNGNMVSGLHEDRWIVRLDPAERSALIASGGSEFAPGGRVMREYATLPPMVVEDPPQVREWLAKSFAYVRSLPAKASQDAFGEGAATLKESRLKQNRDRPISEIFLFRKWRLD